MFETTPPQPDGIDAADPADLADLADPIASVIAVELSRRVVRRALSWAEPMVTDLAEQETVLRQAGGIDLVKRIFAQRFYRRVDAEVFHLLRRCVPLAHAEVALSAVEEVLRRHFSDIVGTAANGFRRDLHSIADIAGTTSNGFLRWSSRDRALM